MPPPSLPPPLHLTKPTLKNTESDSTEDMLGRGPLGPSGDSKPTNKK